MESLFQTAIVLWLRSKSMANLIDWPTYDWLINWLMMTCTCPSPVDYRRRVSSVTNCDASYVINGFGELFSWSQSACVCMCNSRAPGEEQTLLQRLHEVFHAHGGLGSISVVGGWTGGGIDRRVFFRLRSSSPLFPHCALPDFSSRLLLSLGIPGSRRQFIILSRCEGGIAGGGGGGGGGGGWRAYGCGFMSGVRWAVIMSLELTTEDRWVILLLRLWITDISFSLEPPKLFEKTGKGNG